MPGMLWSQVARGRRVGSACTTAASARSACWIRRVNTARSASLPASSSGARWRRCCCSVTRARDQLVPAAGEGLEPSLRLRERGAPRGAHLSREPRQHASIQLIGLGEGAVGAGEVADLARIDHHHRQVRQGGHHRALIPTAGFQHPRGWGLECGQPVAQPVQAAAGAPYRPEPPPSGAQRRPSAAAPHRSRRSHPLTEPSGTLPTTLAPRPALQTRALVLTAPATVRALRQRLGRDDPALRRSPTTKKRSVCPGPLL